MNYRVTQHRKIGFSLVETMIVIVVMAIVATSVIVAFSDAGVDAKISVTVRNVREIQKAALRYRALNGTFPLDAYHGICPPELRNTYLDPALFAKETPIGGLYDWTIGWRPDSSPPSTPSTCVAVRIDPGTSNSYFQLIDNRYDDGNLSTGKIQHHSDYLIFALGP